MENKYSVDDTIRQLKVHYMELLKSYEEKLKSFPRGTLVIRETKGHRYCYFRYRDGKKVVTKYAGTEKRQEELRQLIVKREALLEETKRVRAEIERIERIEGIK